MRTLLVVAVLGLLLGAACVEEAPAPAYAPRSRSGYVRRHPVDDRPQWMITFDSNPANAVVQGNRIVQGRMVFETIGTTPMTTGWTQAFPGETVKIVLGDREVTVEPIPDQSIFVSFRRHPPQVSGARVVDSKD